MADYVIGNNGITTITLTNGKQRKSKRAGISYDFMDRLNQYVKKGIFVDKDKNGFTKQERAALGKEFAALHSERGDITNFRRLKTGYSVNYIDEEFIRLAKAAGYILADEKAKPIEIQNPAVSETPKEEVQETDQKEEVTNPQKVEEPQQTEQVTKTEEPKKDENVSKSQEVTQSNQGDEVETLHTELQEMMSTWSEEDRQFPYAERKLNAMKTKLASDISSLENKTVTETVTKHRWLRKDKTETVVRNKTQEELSADLEKSSKKREEYAKISKMLAVYQLYSSSRPSKYSSGKDDKYLSHIITTKDGKKLGVAREKKTIHSKDYGTYDEYVNVYYPITLGDINADNEMKNNNGLPQYYYRVAKDAKPVDYTE